MRAENERFWRERSKNYENLQWAIRGGYLRAFLNAGGFRADDVVLDVGSGTGIIAHTIAPHVREVIGIDISEDMLALARRHRRKSERFLAMDARDLRFADGSFSKVTARMVFHHILEGGQDAAEECRRVLRDGGTMILSEGVPPDRAVLPFYTEMFKLKEQRLTFMEEDLVALMTNAGFRKLRVRTHWLRRCSVRNWLENSGLPARKQAAIMKMHLNMDATCRRAYRMRAREGDCYIDMKFAIVVGEK